MPHPHALIDGVSHLAPSREAMEVMPLEAKPQTVTVNFLGGRLGFLDLKNPHAAVWAKIIDLQRQTNRPVYVEIDPETTVITQMLVPEVSRVMSITPQGEGDVFVIFYTSEARHYLRRGHPDFQQMLDALQAAKNDGTAILVTAVRRDHEIIDVRPLPKTSGAETPPPSPPLPDPAVSPQRAQQLFDLMSSKSCDPCQADCNAMPHCIPFTYPVDGCYARAHEMCRLMMAENETPEKVWIFGGLLVPTTNNSDCYISWGWHVAPTLMVTQPNGPPVKMVIDPSLCTTPVTPDDWKALQGDPNATLSYTTWEPFWSDLTSTDPDFSQTNYYLQLKCLYLQDDCVDYGPPPYECPVTRDCFIILDRSTFGEDEIDARLQQATPAYIEAAFYVVVDGFKPAIDSWSIHNPHDHPDCLGMTAATLNDPPDVKPTIDNTLLPPGMSVEATHVAVEDSAHLLRRQRVTWTYRVKFDNKDGFAAGFVNDVKNVTIAAQITSATDPSVSVSGSAVIQLIKQPNPFEMDGPVSWLSTDLRVFQIKAGESKFGVSMGSTPADASTFIKIVIANLNSGNTGGQTFETNISTDYQSSQLTLFEKDANNIPIFNFAVARVHYRGKILDAENVRVFFRLFPALTTSLDYNQATTYLRGGQAGLVIPLLGIQNGNLVAIPCFAEPRVDSATVNLNKQTDPANVQVKILHDATGAERLVYFGCWLDINQPSQPQFPVQPPTPYGPFPADRKTIQDLIRFQHQCLVAEIAFDPDPIPPGATPGSSDKLAQRNLGILGCENPGDLGSRRIPITFQIQPSPAMLRPGAIPDELMIDWGNTPVGSLATLYLSGVKATDILQTAVEMYRSHGFTFIDEHTLRCQTGGVTYLPIPPGAGDFVGLLSVDLPPKVHKDQAFTIVVRQVASAVAVRSVGPEGGEETEVARARVQWRRILGTFQVTIPVRPKEVLLEPETRLLSVLRWIQKAIPEPDRWFPVFRRYVDQIAGRVDALGGDAQKVTASPSGEWKDFQAKPCKGLALLTSALLTLLVIALGSLKGGQLVFVGILATAFLVGVGNFWIKKCRPTACSLLRTVIAGVGSGATLLALLFLLGVSTPHLPTILAVSIVATGLAAWLAWFKGCLGNG